MLSFFVWPERDRPFSLFIFLPTLFMITVLQVDTHIQQLDQYLKNFDEKLRHGITYISTFGVLNSKGPMCSCAYGI